jgi:hypothetical protein
LHNKDGARGGDMALRTIKATPDVEAVPQGPWGQT